jgi:tetratricopeptide (TPR) repeat protein
MSGKKSVHARLMDYFANQPGSEANPERVEDLNSFIELYHQSIGANQYDDAWLVLTNRLAGPLYNRFGDHALLSRLLLLLFPDGEKSPPLLRSAADRAWVQRTLAYTLSRLGQLQRGEALFQDAIESESTESDRSNLGACLAGLADVRTQLGKLKLAKEHYQAAMELSDGSRVPILKGVAHRDHARLLAVQGLFDEAVDQNALGLQVFKSLQADQPNDPAWKEQIGLTLAHRAWVLLTAGDQKNAAETARQARDLAEVKGYAFDVLLTEWLLGAAQITTNVEEAHQHLSNALERCHQTSVVRLEPAILLDVARAHQTSGDLEQAKAVAEQALTIAQRCGLRLLQADLNNLLGRLCLKTGDLEGSRRCGDAARQLAICDGEPWCYRPALDESAALLAEAANDRSRPTF